MSSARPYTEASTPVGAILIAIGVLTWGLQYTLGVFTGWIWAIGMGSLWLVLGSLLLFSDMRLYQYDQAPLEKLLVED